MSATAKRTPLRASKRQKTPSKRERKAADNPAPPPEVSRCASELGKAGAKARWAGHVKTAKVSRAEADERSNAATIAAIRRAAATTTAQATPVRVDVRPVDEPLPVDALGRAMSVGEAMKSIRAPLALLAANPSTRAPLSLDAVNDALWHPGATIRAEDGRLDLKATGMLVGATHEDIDGGQPAAWLYVARGPVSDPRLVEIFRAHNGTVYYGATAPNRLSPRDVVALRVAPMKRAAASFILDAADELGVAVELAERANIQARDSVYALFPSTGTRGQWQLSRFVAGEGPTWHQEGPDKIALVELAIGQMPRVVLVPGAVDAAVLMAVTEPLTTATSGGSKSAEGRAGMQTEQVPDTVTRKLDPEEIEEERALQKRIDHESWMHSINVRAVDQWLDKSKSNVAAAKEWAETGEGLDKIEAEIEAIYDAEKASAEAEDHAAKAGADLEDFYFEPQVMMNVLRQRIEERSKAKSGSGGSAKGEAREKYAREAFALHEQSQGRGETPKPAPVAAEPEARSMAAPVDEFGDADVILAHSPEEGTTIRTKPNDRSHNETIKSLGMAFKWWAEGARWYRQKSRGAAEPSIPLRVIAERLRAKGVRVRVSALEDISRDRAASAKMNAAEQRASYLRKRAESKLAKASAESAKAQAISDRIPMGEPVKSWHHSARKHRADILRFERAMDKTMQARRDASKAVSRAESAEEAAKAAREKSAADSWAEPLIKPLGEALLTLKRSVGATAIKLHSKKKDEAVWTVSLSKDYQGFGSAIVVSLSYAGGWLSALDNETQGREGVFWNDRIGSADQAPAIAESLAKAIAAKRNVELKAVEPKKSKAKPANPAEEGALAALPFFARNILSSLDNAAVRAAYGASSRWEVRSSPQMDLRAFPDGPSTINATAALSAFATFSDAGRVELIIAPARDEARQKGWTILVAQESGKADTTPGEAWVAEAKERGRQVAADVLRDVDRMRSAAAERQSDMLLASVSWANWPPKAPGSTPIKPTEQEIEFGRPDTVSGEKWTVALAVREARRLASSVRRTVELQKARGLSSTGLEGDAGTIRAALHGIEIAATSGVTFGRAPQSRSSVTGWNGPVPEHESFMRAARDAVTVWQIRHGIGALAAHPDRLPRVV